MSFTNILFLFRVSVILLYIFPFFFPFLPHLIPSLSPSLSLSLLLLPPSLFLPLNSPVTSPEVTCSGVSRIFVRGVLSFGLLYDCTCVNPKCYPCDFCTRRGRSLAWSGVWRHVLREYIGLQGDFLRQFSRTCPDRLRVALQVTVGDWNAFFQNKFKLDYGNTQ